MCLLAAGCLVEWRDSHVDKNCGEDVKQHTCPPGSADGIEVSRWLRDCVSGMLRGSKVSLVASEARPVSPVGSMAKRLHQALP